jgi:hypothetical protein
MDAVAVEIGPGVIMSAAREPRDRLGGQPVPAPGVGLARLDVSPDMRARHIGHSGHAVSAGVFDLTRVELVLTSILPMGALPQRNVCSVSDD